MPRNVIVLFDNDKGRKVIREACQEHNLNFAEFEELVQVEVEQAGKLRSHKLSDKFDDILDRIQIEEE